LYATVTDGGAGLGRDRSLPIFIQQAFSGWIKKYDKKSSLERAIILTPYARTRCHHEDMSRTIERFPARNKVCSTFSTPFKKVYHKAICQRRHTVLKTAAREMMKNRHFFLYNGWGRGLYSYYSRKRLEERKEEEKNHTIQQFTSFGETGRSISAMTSRDILHSAVHFQIAA
jgi:adenylate kinase family enzyme